MGTTYSSKESEMNDTTYKRLCDQVKQHSSNCHIIYSVYDLATDRLYQMNQVDQDAEEELYLNIVLDENHIDSPINHPTTYYVNSVEELRDLLITAMDNESIFYTFIDCPLSTEPYFYEKDYTLE